MTPTKLSRKRNHLNLTPREMELYTLLTTTYEPIKTLAHSLNLTEGTCKVLAARIYITMRCSSRLELVMKQLNTLREELTQLEQPSSN